MKDLRPNARRRLDDSDATTQKLAVDSPPPKGFRSKGGSGVQRGGESTAVRVLRGISRNNHSEEMLFRQERGDMVRVSSRQMSLDHVTCTL